jgi:hypothetical protein
MFQITESILIEQTPEELFPIVADPFTQLKWDGETLKEVEKLTPGPLGKGTRYRGKFKGLGTLEYEFAEFESGRRFAHLSKLPFGLGRHIFEFEPVPDGTRLTQSMIVDPTLMGRILSPIARVMMRNRLRLINSEIRQYVAES